MRAVLAVCILLAFAGCVSQDPGPVPNAATTAPTGAADARSAPVGDPARGSTTTTTAPTPDGAAEGNATPPAPVEKPYLFDGILAPSACVPAGEGQCLPPPVSFESKWWDAPKDKGIARVRLSLAWTASSPATDALQLILVRAEACGEGCWKGKDAVPRVSGKSPLALDAELPALNETEFLVVAVRSASLAPEPLYGWAHPEQAFRVEGTLTVSP